MKEEVPITLKTAHTKTARLELKKHNLVYVYTNENCVIEMDEVKTIHKALFEMVKGQPCYLIVFPAAGSTSTGEARQYAAKSKNEKNIMAEAVVVNNLALRILASFYANINQPKHKVKLFSSSHSAVNWISDLMKKNEHLI